MHLRSLTLGRLTASLVLLASSSAWAGVNPTKYTDPTDFHAQGTITQVTNFDGYVEGDITYLGDPYTDGQLTFTSTQNSVFGTGYPTYQNVRNALVNNYLEPMNVTIGGTGYNLFAFRICDLVGNADVTLWIDTDQDSFGFGISPYPANEGFKFYGFLAPDNQYFTGFHFSANDSVTAPAFAEFELGKTRVACNTRVCGGGGPIPEPATWALMILGVGSAGVALRRRRGAVAVLA